MLTWIHPFPAQRRDPQLWQLWLRLLDKCNLEGKADHRTNPRHLQQYQQQQSLQQQSLEGRFRHQHIEFERQQRNDSQQDNQTQQFDLL
jgi:hypothetical protein